MTSREGVHAGHDCPGVFGMYNHNDWSRRLVTVCLGTDEVGWSRTRRIDATPEILADIAGFPDRVDDVLACFVAAHQATLGPANGNIVRAAADMIARHAWAVSDHDRPPPFFGLLWATCLVAAGHPDADVDFRERLRRLLAPTADGPVLGGDPILTVSLRPQDRLTGDALGLSANRLSLRDLWVATARWAEGATDHVTLELPDPGRHKLVGTSYKLVAPDLHARRWLSSAFARADRGGYEPPAAHGVPTLLAIAAGDPPRAEFLTELERLRDELQAGRAVDEDPVWRGIADEAVEPTIPQSSTAATRSLSMWLGYDRMAGDWDAWVVSPDGSRPPVGGASWHEDADFDVDPVAVLRLDEDDIGWDTGWSVLERRMLHNSVVGSQLRQGLLCFEPSAGGYHRSTATPGPATSVALVDDRVGVAFLAAFGGRSTRASAAGWRVVTGAAVRTSRDVLPKGLEDVKQLRRSGAIPFARLVGGLRVGRNQFLDAKGLEPTLRAPDAVEVVLVTAGAQVLCERDTETGDFLLPDATKVEGSLIVRWEDPGQLEARVLLRWAGGGVGRCQPVRGDYRFVGPEDDVDFVEEVGAAGAIHAQPAQAKWTELWTDHPTYRRLGPGMGEIGTQLPESAAEVYGRRRRPLALFHDSSVKLRPTKVDSRNLVQWWRDDVLRGSIGFQATENGWETSPLEELKSLARRLDVERGPAGATDHDDIRDRLDRCYGDAAPQRQWFTKLVRVLDAALRRREVGLADLVEWWDTLGYDDGKDAPYEFARALQAAGRIEALQGHVVPAIRFRGVDPTVMLSKVGPCGTKLVEMTFAGSHSVRGAVRLAERVASFADVRWRRSRWKNAEGPAYGALPPLLVVLTDDPRAVIGHATGELGELHRLKSPTVPRVEPAPPDDVHLPGGYEEVHRYHVGADGTEFATCDPTCSAVHISRRLGERRREIYVVEDASGPRYWSRWRSWAALRAAEIAGVPAFTICRHGLVTSCSPRFAALPTQLARPSTLTFGIDQPTIRFDATGRVLSISYDFGPGVDHLMSNCPPDWFKETTCTTH